MSYDIWLLRQILCRREKKPGLPFHFCVLSLLPPPLIVKKKKVKYDPANWCKKGVAWLPIFCRVATLAITAALPAGSSSPSYSFPGINTKSKKTKGSWKKKQKKKTPC
jgi:hypothetical protein